MGSVEILGLLGGLALFLYGMQMMSDGLEDAAGNKMKGILERLTSNRFIGVVVGAIITAVIQSSSATTVMVVGFVNSGMMTLTQAVWIIMGANIGTTITGQLVALDVDAIAPLFAFAGVVMIVFFKNPKLHHIGRILAGFGVLFIGMNMMGTAMEPLKESEAFISLMTRFSNPILGILAGAAFTAIIQSSSASVSILQILAGSGLIGLQSAVFVLFGQNIGTCITAVLASIGANRSAKRTTIIHLMFNVIGTAMFTIACIVLPVTDWVASFTPNDAPKQIANMHTIFNIVTTIVLVPFGVYLAKIAEKILPDKDNEEANNSLTSLNKEFHIGGRTSIGAVAVHTDLLAHEIKRIVKLAGDNANNAYKLVLDENYINMDKINENEATIDILNKEISQYISKILVNNNIDENIEDVEQFFLITGNAERIGDHAVNIAGYTEVIKKKEIVFSDEAREEIEKMRDIVLRAVNKVLNVESNNAKWLTDIASMEQKIDDMTKKYRDKHLERMRQGRCSAEACILYSEMLIDFERMGDHILNIAQAYSKINAISLN